MSSSHRNIEFACYDENRERDSKHCNRSGRYKKWDQREQIPPVWCRLFPSRFWIVHSRYLALLLVPDISRSCWEIRPMPSQSRQDACSAVLTPKVQRRGPEGTMPGNPRVLVEAYPTWPNQPTGHRPLQPDVRRRRPM